MNLKQQLMVVAVAVGMIAGPALCRAAETGAPWPDLEAHRVDGIPLSGYDAPAICNHWLWAQAGTGNNDGLLNMEDVRPGAKPQFSGTTLVSVNGQPLKPNLALADWWPNKVVRRATVEGIAFEGTVVAAHERYALLNRLVASNTTVQAKSVKLEIAGNAASQLKLQPGLAAETPRPEVSPLPAEMASSKLSVQFDPQTQEPRTIVNREAKDSLTLVPESAFRLELDKLKGTAVPAELCNSGPRSSWTLATARSSAPSRNHRPRGA